MKLRLQLPGRTPSAVTAAVARERRTFVWPTFVPKRWILVARKDVYHPGFVGTFAEAMEAAVKRGVELGSDMTVVGDHVGDPSPGDIRRTWVEIRIPTTSILREVAR